VALNPGLRLVPASPEPASSFEWTREDVLVLARRSCRECKGAGLRWHGYHLRPCPCVCKHIFRVVMERRHSQASVGAVRLAALEMSARRRSSTWGFKHEEFCADIDLTAKRLLDPDDRAIFRLRFLERRGWESCCERLKLDPGYFWGRVYSIEVRLGRAFRELQPYPIYPITDYFAGTAATARAKRIPRTASVAA
jgi:hypothetical protein